ncbi:MAG: ABC transporter ATP-binding protein [Rhizobiales bacterium]|nr:ABC transporter ATP-binding protein [Hyphomicrobiales bacterium]
MRDISVDFTRDRNTIRVLKDIDVAIPTEAFIAMLGPSGCGKSTLLRVVSDLVRPAKGSVSVFGKSAVEARRNREIGFVFQDATLLPWRTVIDNVRLPLEIKEGASRIAGSYSPEEMLALVGLDGRHNAYPHELSGGMRQRVAIARALICRTRLLLMDEPFGALDELTRDKMNEELLRIWRETRTTILFVTHSIAEATYLGQQVMVMAANPGRIRETVPIDFGDDRSPAVRDTPQFLAYTARLRRLLEAH